MSKAHFFHSCLLVAEKRFWAICRCAMKVAFVPPFFPMAVCSSKTLCRYSSVFWLTFFLWILLSMGVLFFNKTLSIVLLYVGKGFWWQLRVFEYNLPSLEKFPVPVNFPFSGKLSYRHSLFNGFDSSKISLHFKGILSFLQGDFKYSG